MVDLSIVISKRLPEGKHQPSIWAKFGEHWMWHVTTVSSIHIPITNFVNCWGSWSQTLVIHGWIMLNQTYLHILRITTQICCTTPWLVLYLLQRAPSDSIPGSFHFTHMRTYHHPTKWTTIRDVWRETILFVFEAWGFWIIMNPYPSCTQPGNDSQSYGETNRAING